MGMIEKDYIMRLTYEIIRTLLRLIFGIDLEKKAGPLFEEKKLAERYETLRELIENGKVEEAENRLLGELNVYDRRELELALYFYAYLNGKDSDFLEEHNFSRREIAEGIKMVCSLFGYGTMAESLMDEIDLE